MRKKFKMLIPVLIVAVLCGSVLQAEEGDRNVEVRGIFVERAEHQAGEREFLALVVKPFESDDHVVVLVPRNEDFMRAARELREGDKVEAACVVEEGQKWLKRIKVERRIEKGRPERDKPKGEHPEMAVQMEKMHAQIAELKEAAEQARREGRHDKADMLIQKVKRIAQQMKEHAGQAKEIKRPQLKEQIIHLKEMAAEAKKQGQMEKAQNLWAHAEELERNLKREFGHPDLKKAYPLGRPEMPPPVLPQYPPQQIQMQLDAFKAQIKEGLEHHLKNAHEQLKNAVAGHLERMAQELERLMKRVEEMEKAMHEIHSRNERLTMELRERQEVERERERQDRERRELEERRRFQARCEERVAEMKRQLNDLRAENEKLRIMLDRGQSLRDERRELDERRRIRAEREEREAAEQREMARRRRPEAEEREEAERDRRERQEQRRVDREHREERAEREGRRRSKERAERDEDKQRRRDQRPRKKDRDKDEE